MATATTTATNHHHHDKASASSASTSDSHRAFANATPAAHGAPASGNNVLQYLNNWGEEDLPANDSQKQQQQHASRHSPKNSLQINAPPGIDEKTKTVSVAFTNRQVPGLGYGGKPAATTGRGGKGKSAASAGDADEWTDVDEEEEDSDDDDDDDAGLGGGAQVGREWK